MPGYASSVGIFSGDLLTSGLLPYILSVSGLWLMGTTLLFSLSVTSANGQQEFPGCYILWMLEDRGSRCWSRQVAVILFTSGGWEEGQEKQGEGKGGEGRGNSFCERRQFWLSRLLHPRLQRLCPVGKGAFPELEEADSQTLDGGTQWLLGVGWGRHWVLFHELRFCFSNRLDWSMSHWAALVLDGSRGFESKVCQCLWWCRGIQCCLSPSNVWRWFGKVNLHLASTSFGGIELCIGVCVWKWIITEFTKMFSDFIPFPYLFYTWWIRFLNLEWKLPAFLQLHLLSDNRVHLLNFFPPLCLAISSSSSSCFFLSLSFSPWCYFVCKSSSRPFAELKPGSAQMSEVHMWIQTHAGLPVFAGCPFSAFFFKWHLNKITLF